MYRDISVEEFEALRKSGTNVTLLDVREPRERAVASIEGSVHIPIGEIVARSSELPKDAEIAVFCHHGGRSAQVAQYLSGHGFRSVVNVDGGIDAYAQKIDSTIPRY